MANLADNSGDAYSNLVHGTGTNSVTFEMPGNVPLAVESVVATVDNTLGTATKAKLTVRDSAGVVIATSSQVDTIPAGDTGTATFALRLGGSGAQFSSLNGGLGFYKHTAITIPSGFAQLMEWTYMLGAPLLDVSGANLTLPIVLKSGVYAVTATAITFAPVAGAVAEIVSDGNSAAAVDNFAAQTFPLDDAGDGDASGTASWVGFAAAGDTLDVSLDQISGGNVVFDILVNVQRIALV